MITQEFLDKLNNSQIGKIMRLENFQCSKETLNKIGKILDNPFMDIEFLKQVANNAFGAFVHVPDEVNKIMEEENTFVFDKDNIESVISGLLFLDVSKLPDGLKQNNMRELKGIVDNLDIKELSLKNISGEVEFEDLAVDELTLSGDVTKVDFSKLKSINSLILSYANIKDTEAIKKLNNIKALTINRSGEYPEIDFSGLFEMAGLERLSIEGQKLTDNQTIQLLNKQNLNQIYNGYYGHNRLLGNEVIVTNPEELKIVANSEYYKNREELKIAYVGKEELSSDVLSKSKNKKIKLELLSPLVLSDEFCMNLNDNENLHIEIENDCYPHYKLAEISAINREMKNILEKVPKDASDFDKVKYLYSKIGTEVTYDMSGIEGESYIEGREDITRSLKGGLLEKKLVCYGYALEFNILAKELGLNCNMLGGKIYSKEEVDLGGHEWNQVEIDGSWYNLDLTWDSGMMQKGKEIEFFLLQDDEFNNSIEYSRKAIEKDEQKSDFLNKDGTFDYSRYIGEGKWDILPKRCDKTYDRMAIEKAFKSENIAVNTSQIMVRSLEEASKDVRASDIKSSAQAIIDTEQQRKDLEDEIIK